MKNRILLLFIIQFILFTPQISVAKISAHSLETQAEQSSIKIFPKKKTRPFFKKKPKDHKKMGRSLLLFLLSLFSAILAINTLGTVSIVLFIFTLLFGLMGAYIGNRDWKEHKNFLARVGFVLNLIFTFGILLLISSTLGIL